MPTRGNNTRLSDMEEIKIKINTDTSSAVNALKELRRQANLLSDISEQGSKRQHGFLSPNQLKLVKRMLSEVEKSYESHYNKLQDMEREHSEKKEILEKEIVKRQKSLNYSQGQNPNGDVLPVDEQERRQVRLDESIADMSSLSDMENSIEGMREAVSRLGGQRARANDTYSNEIGQMHTLSPQSQKNMASVGKVVETSGMVLSVEALARYIGQGISTLIPTQAQSSDLGQKLGDYEGNDEGLRKNLLGTGNKSQYGFQATAVTARELIRGGTKDTELLKKDIESTQQAGRAYAVDPNLIAQGGAMLKQMGTLEEGQMQRFANMIGGSIVKNGMNGREEEQIRSSMNLISQATSKMADVGKDKIGNVMGIQSWLGNAVPSLKGDKGAQVLSTMDSSIKGADNTGDILMGWGTKYKGIEGRKQLEYIKEEGIANAGNVQEIFKNTKNMLGANSSYKELALNKVFGMSYHNIEALNKSGALKSMENGTAISTDALSQLSKDGSIDKNTLEQLEKYNSTDAKRRRSNDAQSEKVKTGLGYLPSRIWEGGRELFHSQPLPVRKAELVLGALGVGALGKKYGMDAIRAGYKLSTSTINGAGGLWNGLKGLFKPGGVANASNATTSHISTGWGMMDDAVKSGGQFTSQVGADALASSGGKGIFGAMGKVLGKGGSLLTKYGAKSLPVVGTILGAGMNKLSGDSWGKSLTKAGIGTGIALGAGALLAPFTAGASLGVAIAATATVGVGSVIAGDAIGDSLYRNEKKPIAKDKESVDNAKAQSKKIAQDKLIADIVSNIPDPKQQAVALSRSGNMTLAEAEAAISAYKGTSISTPNTSTNTIPKDAEVIPPSSNYSNPYTDDHVGKTIDPYSNSLTDSTSDIPQYSQGDTTGSKIASMIVTNMKVEKLEFGKDDDKSSEINESLKRVSGEHVLRIIIDGKIDGMTPNNQTQVKNSISDYFSAVFKGSSHQKVNLSFDNKWK